MQILVFILLFAALCARTAFCAIEVTFNRAPEGPVAYNAGVTLDAYVRSTTPVESVWAGVGDWQIPLNHLSTLTNNGWYGSTWVRSFGLPELRDGPTNLVVTVNAVGEMYVTNRVIIIHSPPTMTVHEPFDGIVLEPGERLPVRATAFDEDGDVGIRVSTEYVMGRTNVFDERLPLSRSGTLTIQALGNYGQTTTRSMSYLIQTNAKLRTVAKVPGVILNADATRILYHSDQREVRVKRLSEQSDGPAIHRATNGWVIQAGFLTAGGTIVLERDTAPISSYRGFEVGASNEVTALGAVHRSGMQVSGRYAAWIDPMGTLFRRDLVARTTQEITNNVNGHFHPISLAENGNVSFTVGEPSQIYLYRAGDIELLPNPTEGTSNWTDGTNVVYFKGREMDKQPPLVLHTAGGSMTLSTVYYIPPVINNGWVAFSRVGGEYPIWTYSPTGSLQPRARGGVLALNEKGELLLELGGKRHLNRADGSVVDFGLIEANPIYRNGQWEFIYYSALLRPIESFDKQMVIMENDSTLNVRFLGEPGKTYQIQSAPSLQPPVTWTPHRPAARVDANDSLGFLEPAPSTNRFYRAVEVQP